MRHCRKTTLLYLWKILQFKIFALFLIVGLANTVTAAENVRFSASKPFVAKKLFLKAELYKPPAKGPHPSVILMHGCGGLGPDVYSSLRSHALFLLRRGFVVLIVDSFGPRHSGNGWVCKTFKRLRQARNYRISDALDAVNFLKTKQFVDKNNIFLMGQSNGGSVALLLAQQKKKTSIFRAVAAYYPWCGALKGKSVKLNSPLIIFGGKKDDWVPPTQCSESTGENKILKTIVYPNAAHSFDLNIPVQRYLGKRVGRDRFATRDSRRRMYMFFKQNIKTASNKVL